MMQDFRIKHVGGLLTHVGSKVEPTQLASKSGLDQTILCSQVSNHRGIIHYSMRDLFIEVSARLLK